MAGRLRELKEIRVSPPWIGTLILCLSWFLCLFLIVDVKRSEATRRTLSNVFERVHGVVEWPPKPPPQPERPRNVILMIGDGMGLAQVTLAYYRKGQLALADMPFAGYSYTHSLRDFVTDSAAGATALASGYRVMNGVVGQHPDGTPTKTVVEFAEERGMWTGLVATSRITHATPAAMVAHVDNRNQEEDIAVQLAESGVEVLLGGGWDRFYGARADGRNLVEEMERRGYLFVRTARELTAAPRETTKLLGLFSATAMPKVTENRAPALAAMAVAALRVLERAPEGFFLMIEGSQIDWGGHQNDDHYVAQETIDFDNTLGAVLRFLDEAGIGRDTLIVVTADHETGGLTLHRHPRLALDFEPRWTTDLHTGVPVPVFARGPAARFFAGMQNHPDIGRKLISLVAGRAVEFTYPVRE